MEDIPRRLTLVAQASSVASLEDTLEDLALEVGFTEVSYYRLSRLGAAVVPELGFGAGFGAWITRYVEKRYGAVDPVIPLVFRRDLPFTAREVERLAPEPASLHADRRRLWAADGLFCPIAGSWGETGVVCWACDQEILLQDEERLAMDALSRVSVTRFKQLAPDDALPDLPLRPLSRRESECAFWMSRGKRGNEIAEILGLSIHTVRQYIDSAVQKLGAQNRGEMLLRASVLGLISERASDA